MIHRARVNLDKQAWKNFLFIILKFSMILIVKFSMYNGTLSNFENMKWYNLALIGSSLINLEFQ